MLTRIEAYNTEQGDTLSLPLLDYSNGYVVKDIEGLDPVKAMIVSSNFAQLDGTQYQASRRENRNILLKLGFEPDYMVTSVRQLRSKLYGFFMPKTQVTLRFYIDDIHFVDISGRVESFEAPLFTSEPEVNISLLCFDPNFVSPNTVTVSGSTVASSTDMTIAYPGSVETGFVFTLSLDRTVNEITLYSTPPGGEFQSLEFVAPLSAGDVLTISTVSGAKRATLTRAGTDSSILWGITPVSKWLNLFPGDNLFRAFTEGVPIPFTLEYVAKYGGL